MLTTTTPRRGRPPRLSRGAIVEAVAEMLLADPAAPLTIVRAAEAVGAAPMSLYRHVAGRDDLVDAVARHLFARTRATLPAGASWQDELRAWMFAAYDLGMRVPQLVRLIAQGESTAWLGDSAHLARVLQRAGITDDRRLAEAVYWVASTTMGQMMIHAAAPHEPPAGRWRQGIEHLAEDDAAVMRRLVPHLAGTLRESFEKVVARTILQLERDAG